MGSLKSWLARRVSRIADGKVEVDPLVDAERQFVFVLEAFEDEPVVPGGEVLDGGDAVGERVLDGELESPAACVVAGWRDVFFDERAGGRFADDAGGLALRIAVDVTAEGIGCGGVDARGFECGGVGDGDVAVDAIEKGGVGAGDGVEVLTRGQSFRRPLGVVPTAAEDPCVRVVEGFSVGGDAGLHFGERGDAVEVGGEALQAGVGDVGVGVVEAGHGEGAVEVDLVCLGGGAPEDFGVGAGEDDAVAGDAEGLDALRCGVALISMA